MAICPECGKEISCLNVVTQERVAWTYKRGDFLDPESLDFAIQYWECPVCLARLFLNPSEECAQQFLDGEDVYDWVDKHSVNCFDCGVLMDERECVPGDEITGDGGSLCEACYEKRVKGGAL